ncbi:YggS family pyridoxal phosphate-dependent enzyme [Desulfonatronum parangueonense]
MKHDNLEDRDAEGSARIDSRELIWRYEETRNTVAEIAARHGREPGDVRIIAVSKYQPTAALKILAGHGHLDFGENYIQEALRKQGELALPELHWHYLGRLQRNKAKFVPGSFTMFHALDDELLASSLQKRSKTRGSVLEVLVQVNLGQEIQKGGVLPDQLPELAEKIRRMDGLALRGLMALPPFSLELPEKQRLFSELRDLRDKLQSQIGLALPELSMGTTDDFPQAIAEGATMVRIGTRIFGERPR